MAFKKIGVIVADKDEFKPFEVKAKSTDFKECNFYHRKGLSFKINDTEVIGILCGIGKVNAAAAAMHLIDNGCDTVLSYGLSGGISGVRRGDLAIGTRFLEHDFDLTGIGYMPCEKPDQEFIYYADKTLLETLKSVIPNAVCGTAVCGDRFVSCDEDRIFLKETFDAVSCDMETGAIAYVCDMAKIPFIALRRISDDAGDDAADSYREMNTCSETVLTDVLFEFIDKLSRR